LILRRICVHFYTISTRKPDVIITFPVETDDQ